VLLVFFIVCKAITESAYFHKVNRCAWQVKTAVSTSITVNPFDLPPRNKEDDFGRNGKLHANRCNPVGGVCSTNAHVLWDGIFQITGYMLILGLLLGWPCIVGLILMCFAGPVMGSIMGKLFRNQPYDGKIHG
jgi:hypothetical protein